MMRLIDESSDGLRRFGVGHFDLVVIDLMLPDSTDEDATVTRIANMGKFRVAVVSGSDKRNAVVASLTRAGVDCAPQAIGKEDLPLADFVRRPELFRDFIHGLMPPAGTAPTARAASRHLRTPRHHRRRVPLPRTGVRSTSTAAATATAASTRSTRSTNSAPRISLDRSTVGSDFGATGWTRC